MTLNRLILPLFCASLVALPALAQNAAPAQPSTTRKDPVRADAYYNFTMRHIYEHQYEHTGAGEYASRPIHSYKKAYPVDPTPPVTRDGLAEMHCKPQRPNEPVTKAVDTLKRN